MSEIRRREPKFDENGKLVVRQECCATCKLRMSCDKLYEVRKKEDLGGDEVANEYANLLVAMYYICDDYDAMYIHYPITVNRIVSDSVYDMVTNETQCGMFCIVSVNSVDYDEDIHLGIMLGMLPTSIMSMYDTKEHQIVNKFSTQPCVYVPFFQRLFFGYNMRWKPIESIADMQTISKSDPQEYIELAKKILQKNKKNT